MIHKELLLNLLDAFVDICSQNNYTYYFNGGTVLGAVRHKGFIPWDDDIDVYLFRDDYEKIQQLPDSIWPNNMQLSSYRRTENYRYDFLKLELTDTTIIERLYPVYVGGVFLDIFPLDILPNKNEEYEFQKEQINRIIDKYLLLYFKNYYECKSLIDCFILYLYRKHNVDCNLLFKWDEIASNGGVKDGSIVANYHSWIDNPMPIEYFGKGVMLEFEGKQYRVPAQYDKYLRHRFGDYMTLPPESERRGHSFLYANYERRLSDKELKPIISELKKRYAYNFSIKKEIKSILRLLHLRK